jgi:hypothetical protein
MHGHMNVKSVFKFENFQRCQSVGSLKECTDRSSLLTNYTQCLVSLRLQSNSQCSQSRPACPVCSFCLDGNRRAARKNPDLIELFFFPAVRLFYYIFCRQVTQVLRVLPTYFLHAVESSRS